MAGYLGFYGRIGSDEGLHVLDADTAEPKLFVATGLGQSHAAVAPRVSGSRCVVMSQNQPLLEVDIASGDVQPVETSPPLPEHEYGGYRVGAITFGNTAAGEVMAVSLQTVFAGNYDVCLYETTGWTLLGVLPGSSQARQPAFSADGSVLAVCEDMAPYIRYYETAAFSALSNPAVVPLGLVSHIAYSAIGGYFAALVESATSPSVMLYAADRAHIHTFPGPTNRANGLGLAFSPDGDRLFVHRASFANGSESLYVFDPGELTSVASLSIPSEAVGFPYHNHSRVSSDGGWLFIADRVADTTTWELTSYYQEEVTFAFDKFVLDSPSLGGRFWRDIRNALTLV